MRLPINLSSLSAARLGTAWQVPAPPGRAWRVTARQHKGPFGAERKRQMHIARVTLRSKTPYSQSRNIDPLEHPAKPKETKDAYEERTWSKRLHVDSNGYVFIPPTAFENAIREAAKRLAISVPGKGKTLYSKYFEAGIQIPEGITLSVKAEDVKGERLFVPSDGKPGGGKRVYKRFPRIDSWSGGLTIYIFDDIIPESVFRRVLESSGDLVGIGRFRPQSRGFYGRYSVESFQWIEDGSAALAGAAE